MGDTHVTGQCGVPDLDRLLATRGLRHHTLGPTGARVFCAHLDNALGVRGRFCLLHDQDDARLPDPIVLRVSVNDQPLTASRAACMWYPSHARRQTKEAGLGISEHKFITWDDVICDVLVLTNHAKQPLSVRLEAETGAVPEVTRSGRDTLAGSALLLEERTRVVLAMPTTKGVPAQTLVCDLTLDPAESTSLLIALAVGLRQGEAQAALKRWALSPDPLARQQHEMQRWFADHCPTLDCPDERFTRLWWYRWFLLRHNLVRTGDCPAPDAQPQLPGLSSTSYLFHEARHDAHAQLHLAGAPLVLQEARWLRDPAFVHGEVRAVLNQDGDPAGPPQEWLPAAMWQALHVWPDRDLTAQAADWSLRHLAAVRKRCDPNSSLLLSGGVGPLGPDAEAGLPLVEAVDHTAMFAASLQAAGEMLSAAGRDVDARWHAGLAERCRAALLEQMWDDWDHFFHDRAPDTGQPLRTPQAGGFAPFAFGLVPDDAQYARALALLTDDAHFWTEHPVALVSRGAADGAEGLLAAGLTLPYTNSLVAEAMAVALRALKQRHITRRRLMDFLWLYAGLQLEGDDPLRLLTREAYDTTTGEGYGALDCLQSSFNDLLIRHVAGLTPRPDDTLEVAPLCTGWDWFALRDVPYRGRLVTILWDKRPDRKRPPDVPRGLSVYINGDLVAESPDLERLTVPL